MWVYDNLFTSTEGEPYDAERHLALGTKDSAEQLAKVEYEWYTQDESYTAALYAARAVFPYLLTSNLRSANKAYLIFTSRLSSSNKSLSVQEVSSTSADMRVYPSLPLLNFLGLLLLAVQRGSSDLYKQLAKHYAPYVKEVGTWDDALAQVGEMYFGIRIPRPGNPLMVCTFPNDISILRALLSVEKQSPRERSCQHPSALSDHSTPSFLNLKEEC